MTFQYTSHMLHLDVFLASGAESSISLRYCNHSTTNFDLLWIVVVVIEKFALAVLISGSCCLKMNLLIKCFLLFESVILMASHWLELLCLLNKLNPSNYKRESGLLEESLMFVTAGMNCTSNMSSWHSSIMHGSIVI